MCFAGFVNFKEPDAAGLAVDELNGRETVADGVKEKNEFDHLKGEEDEDEEGQEHDHPDEVSQVRDVTIPHNHTHTEKEREREGEKVVQ